jgi:hypothetical protein
MERTIKTFYTAFANHDWQTMQSCYHAEATFSDPVFHALTCAKTKAMWHMLLLSANGLTVTFHSVKTAGNTGSCSWEASYLFSKTDRKVHNVITANFTFKDGKILSHADSFNVWKWAGMALGMRGKLLGWTPWLQNKIRSTAMKGLSKFIEDHPQYAS